MYNMLGCEFFKLGKSKAFFAILLVQFIRGIISPFVFLGDKIGSTYTVGMYLVGLRDITFFIIGMSIFAGIFIGNDFKNKTIQGSVSCGTSRIAVFSSKVIVFFFAIILINIIHPLMMFISSIIFINPHEIIPLERIKTLLLLTIACVLSNCVLASISTVFAFWFKDSAATIGVSLGVLLLGGNMIEMATRPYPSLTEYLPIRLSQALIFAYPSGAIKGIAATEDFIRVGIVAIGYTIIFLTIAYGIFRKAELK